MAEQKKAKAKTKAKKAKAPADPNAPKNKGGRPPKYDYDDDLFYNEIHRLALQGATNSEIATLIGDTLGFTLDADTFQYMVKGVYDKWTKEQNERRSKRLVGVLTHARENINSIVRGRYLKMALGGVKVKSKSVTKRHLVVDGRATDDEIVQVVETESETAPSLSALATWLRHHDPEWRNKEINKDEDLANLKEPEKGVSVEKWIEQETKN